MVCLLCILSACGKKNGGKDIDSDGQKTFWGVYREGEAQGKIRAEHLQDGVLYCAEDVGGSVSLYRREQTSAGEEKVFDFAGNVLDFAFLTDGRILSVETPGAKAEAGDDSYRISLCVYGTDGNLASSAEVSALSDFLRARLRILEPDAVILCLDQSIYRLNLDGGIVWKLENLDFRIQDLSVSPANDLILTQSTGKKKVFHQVNAQGVLTKNTGSVSEGVLLPECMQGLYAADDGNLFELDEKGNMTKLLNLTENGLDSSRIRCMEKLSGETESYAFFLMNYDETQNYDFVFLKENVPAEGTETVAKNTLRLAALEPRRFQESVVSFNKKSQKYKAVFEEYLDDSDIRKQQIEASLASSNPPDLLEIKTNKSMLGSSMEDYLNYIQKGVIKEIDGLFEKDVYLEFVVDRFTVDGKVYGLPNRFSIETLVCPAEFLDGKTSWTINEFLSFMEVHPNAHNLAGFGSIWTKSDILRICMTRGIYEYVDFEAGKASFTSDSFKNILQRIRDLKVTTVSESKEERDAQGEAVIWELDLRSPEDLRTAQFMKSHGKELTMIGYPRKAGESGEVINFGSFFAINAKASEQEGAEEFVREFAKSGLSITKGDIFGFPTGKETFEKALQFGTEKTYILEDDGSLALDENGEPIEFIRKIDGIPDPPISEKQVEMIRKSCENAVFYRYQEETVCRIVWDEFNQYLNGDATLESTVDKIQSRVQLLLDEGK